MFAGDVLNPGQVGNRACDLEYPVAGARRKLILYRNHRNRVARLLDLPADTLDKGMASRWNRSHERVLSTHSGKLLTVNPSGFSGDSFV